MVLNDFVLFRFRSMRDSMQVWSFCWFEYEERIERLLWRVKVLSKKFLTYTCPTPFLRFVSIWFRSRREHVLKICDILRSIIDMSLLWTDLVASPHIHPRSHWSCHSTWSSTRSIVSTSSVLPSVQASHDVPVMLDTGCSFLIRPFSDNVVGEITAADVGQMHGLKDACKVTGMGWVTWPIWDVFDRKAEIYCRAYIIPEARVRLWDTHSEHSPYWMTLAIADPLCGSTSDST